MNNSDNKVLRLNNFEDFGPSRLKLLKYIENNCLEYLINSGYSNVDPPILESADLFFKNHKKFNEYINNSNSFRHLELKAIKSHGFWDGKEPFKSQEINQIDKDNSVAVITRATLNLNRLISFWKSVPEASSAIKNAKGVTFYKGIGELPFIQQATISIWKNNDAINDFAYNQKEHAEIIKKTRKNNWYKEDLFSRFIVLSNSKNKFKN